jgi:hypothetical protein
VGISRQWGSAGFVKVLDQQQQGDAHQSQRSAAVMHLRLADRAGGFLMLGPGESHGNVPTILFYITPPRKRVGTAAFCGAPLQTVTPPCRHAILPPRHPQPGLTAQVPQASTGVLPVMAMPVSSPYALFRAADHAWPPPLRSARPGAAVVPGAVDAPADKPVTGRYNQGILLPSP